MTVTLVLAFLLTLFIAIAHRREVDTLTDRLAFSESREARLRMHLNCARGDGAVVLVDGPDADGWHAAALYAAPRTPEAVTHWRRDPDAAWRAAAHDAIDRGAVRVERVGAS